MEINCVSIVPIFNHLEKGQLAEIGKVIRTTRFKKGENIYRAGERSDSLLGHLRQWQVAPSQLPPSAVRKEAKSRRQRQDTARAQTRQGLPEGRANRSAQLPREPERSTAGRSTLAGAARK